MLNLVHYMEERRAIVDAALDRYLPPESERPARLHQAMRYSLLNGGKRLRPILCMATAEYCCESCEAGLIPGVALELLHTHTLIHDDLPAMDNSDLRRGKATSHKVYGEANAILAGDALLTLAFEVLSFAKARPPHADHQLVYELARAAGSRGVAGGQMEDLASEGQEATPDQLEFIHLNKTAALIRAASRMGAIAGGASPAELEILGQFGEQIGLAFQAADDILDATSTAKQIGKTVGSDAQHEKMTYVALYGLDHARKHMLELVKSAHACLARLSHPAPVLSALADFAINRRS